MTPKQMYDEIISVVQPGDVINFDSRGKTFYMRWVFRQIRKAQKKMGFKRYEDIHSVLVLKVLDDVAIVLSATVPEVVIEPLGISKRTRTVTVSRLKGSGEGFSQEWIETMREAAKGLVGRGYDFLDMLAIKLRLQKWPRWITGLLDLGKKRVVCSGAVQYCLGWAWVHQEWHSAVNKIKRPLNGLAPKKATPAHFVNDETFEIVHELVIEKGGR
ncbi:MAG: hypothetical protein KKE05_02880 [Nanoarchaeota archaeon]|nr:hypothetical protein [Nanoarchaeota archaeon]